MSARLEESSAEAGTDKVLASSEALVLRGVPERPVRLSRPAIITASASALIAISVSFWVALGGGAGRSITIPPDHEPSNVPEAIREGPETYADTPILGPRLPGDLGRPILLHQNQGGNSPVSDAPGGHERANIESRDAELLQAARSAGLIVPATGYPSRGGNVSEQENQRQVSSMDQGRAVLASDADPNSQQRKADFLATNDRPDSTNPHRLVNSLSPNMVLAGSVISASLITAIESDLPGLIIAQVTERVFDSVTGAVLLIPQGTRLMGSYDSVVAFGQRRAFVVWQRLVFPDGSALTIENVPAADPSGRSGLTDRVNSHALALLQGAAISTMLGIGANLSLSEESDLVQAVRESTQQNVSRAGDQLTSRNLQIQPSINIRPGAPVRLIVHRDLVLKPWSR